MQILPWRVKNFFSDQFPLAYHLVANVGAGGNSREHWDARLAETWDAPNRSWPAKVDAIEQTIDLDESVIDVGCGTGSILRALQQRGFAHLHGLELSEFAVNRLTAQGIEMSHGDLLNMPLNGAAFDVAIASEVLEHVIRRRRFMRELTRIVKPFGKILIFVPDDCLGPISEPEHVIKYNATSLRKFLGKFLIVESIMSMVEPHNGARSLFAIGRTFPSTR
jgi:2-polyprenyl-3-methyl-5-hydroxy-6-metoxy-1,4-benzoquinol methylase